MSNNQFTNTTINDAASTGGFAALSSPSTHAGVGATSTSEQTPIAPSTLNAVHDAPLSAHSTSTTLPSTTSATPFASSGLGSSGNVTNSGLPQTSSTGISSSSTTGSGATHTRYEEPNIPATAQNLAAKAPSGEEIQQKSHQYIDQAAELAAQAKVQAGELVAPKEKSELNDAEASLDSVTRGIAGMLATAPLAGIEKISPVVAQKLDTAAQNIAASYHQNVEPAAGAYAQQASDAVRSYLPASLGGKAAPVGTTGAAPADGTTIGERANAAAQAYLPESLASKLPGAASTEAVTTTTTGSTGPTVTEQASSALNSASQSASNTANSAAQSAKQTADAYLPASVSSKLPGSSSTTSGVSTGHVDSPYVPLSQDKPTSTLPSTAARGHGADSALVSDFSSSTGTSSQFSGLEPATTAQLPSATSTTGSVAHPTLGAPAYKANATGDYKSEQTAFAPAEYAAEKHNNL